MLEPININTVVQKFQELALSNSGMSLEFEVVKQIGFQGAQLLDKETQLVHVSIIMENHNNGAKLQLWIYEEGQEFSDLDLKLSLHQPRHAIVDGIQAILCYIVAEPM